MRVLELFAGPGTMRAQVWGEAEEVVGIDSDLGSIAEYHGDAARTLRHLDVRRFNVFDADAFARPWEVVWLVSRRSAMLPDDIAVFTTQGAAIASMCTTYAMGGWSRQMMDAVGVDPDMALRSHLGERGAALAARTFLESFFSDRAVTQFATARGGGSGGTLYAGARLAKRPE